MRTARPPARRKSWLAIGLIAPIVWLGALGGSLPAHAEPVPLHGLEAPGDAARADGSGAEDTPAQAAEFQASEEKPGAASAALAAAERPRQRATAAPPPSDRETAANAARNAGELPYARPAKALEALAETPPSWQREINDEIKEMIRPVYAELATAGVLDAIEGIKSYLDLHDASPAAAARVAARANEEAGDNELGTAKSAKQIERQRMITALFIEEWIATLKPWFFALIGLYLLWQLARLGWQFSRWKNRCRHQRSASPRRSRKRSVRLG